MCVCVVFTPAVVDVCQRHPSVGHLVFRRTGAVRKSSPRRSFCPCPPSSSAVHHAGVLSLSATLSWIISLPVIRPVSGQKVKASKQTCSCPGSGPLVCWTLALVFSLFCTEIPRACRFYGEGWSAVSHPALEHRASLLNPDQRFWAQAVVGGDPAASS